MVRLSVNELTTYRWSFEEDIANYLAAGIGAVGVWRPKLSDYGEEKGAELLAENGLEVSNLMWAGGFTGSDGRNFREAVADARQAIRIAGALRSSCLTVYAGGRAGHTLRHARRLLVAALKELLPVAQEEDVVLALEPMHARCAADCTFLTTLGATTSVINEFDSPFIQLAFDTYHFGHDVGAIDRLDSIADRIAIVHLGDSREPPGPEQSRCALGRGEVPLAEIVMRLVEGGYDGYFDVELIGEEIEMNDYRRLLMESRQFIEELLPVAP